MGSAWKKAKAALGLRLCIYAPGSTATIDSGDDLGSRQSDAAAPDSLASDSSSGHRLSKSSSRCSKKTCAICLGYMKPGKGHALFTAECSHTFHFHCIASSVKHGNQVCPVCRAKWKDIPFQGGPQSSELPHGRARVNPVNWSQDVDGYTAILRRLPRAISSNRHHHLTPLFSASEPSDFDDDEPLDSHPEVSQQEHGSVGAVHIMTYPELSAIPQSSSVADFAILVHLKAPRASTRPIPARMIEAGAASNNIIIPQATRAPVDLVTVLDVSGSMQGTKLALVKRAMGFVIQNLGPSDRLSVIAFSSSARRLFQLRRMSEVGRQQALQAVNSLVATGGTNIAEGLRKGAKVIEERTDKNPVCSIILLSDGQDTYTVSSQREQLDYMSLVPHGSIPVHAFGFGADHDSAAMHTISEISGGTYSFIEAEGVIQDAFAQCIGGLLSVVVQGMHVGLECLAPGVRLSPIKSGGYASRVADNGRTGSIDVGDLYADEERDFLVSISVPPAASSEGDVALLKVVCDYRDPVSKEMVSLEGEAPVRIQRPQIVVVGGTVSIEVERERNRVQAAEAMAKARLAAERGLLTEAVSILEERRRRLSESIAGGDPLCVALDAELKEMQERMASRQRYEASGRAYVLSGLSSHSWQRATARGDSTDSTSLVHAYQTPSMVDMVHRSQVLNHLSPPSPKPPLRPARSGPLLRQ